MTTMPDSDRLIPHHRPKRPAPASLERMLRTSESTGALSLQQRSQITLELHTLRRDLEQRTCSAAWLSNCWESGETFPPAAQATPMRTCGCERCKPVGRLWPAHYSAPPCRVARKGAAIKFLSYECYLESLPDQQAAELPSSPSGIALRAIREGRIRLRRRRTRTVARRFSR